jgi:hypothetical protein
MAEEQAAVEGAVKAGGYEIRIRGGALTAARAAVVAGCVAKVLVLLVHRSTTREILVWGSTVVLVVGALTLARYEQLRRLGCLLRIDAEGLTVAGQPTLPWRDLRKTETARGAVVFFSWGADASLPMLPDGSLPWRASRRRDRLTERFGSPMVLPTRLYGVRSAEVMDAIHTYDVHHAAVFR